MITKIANNDTFEASALIFFENFYKFKSLKIQGFLSKNRELL